MSMRKIELGAAVLELAPKKGNPRNSEGAFLTLTDGRILFAYSRFKGDSSQDSAKADVSLLFSDDDGKSFSEDNVILTCEGEEAVNIMSLSLLEMQNGDIGLFYLVRTNYSLMRMYVRRSTDNGKTWGARVLCTPQEGFFVVNNDRVVRLQDGRIIIPAAIHRKGFCDSPEDGADYFDSRSDVMFFYSDDDGATWNSSKNKCNMPYTAYCESGLQEPGLLELSPGLLWGWARTDLGRQYETFSMDNGETWTAVQPSRFTSPNSPLCMKRDKKGRIYTIWNPVPLHNGKGETVGETWTGGRTPLVIAVSEDNGKTFSQPVILEEEESRGYCYCAIHFTEEALLLAYCAGGPGDVLCLARTRVRRIPLEQLAEINAQ